MTLNEFFEILGKAILALVVAAAIGAIIYLSTVLFGLVPTGIGAGVLAWLIVILIANTPQFAKDMPDTLIPVRKVSWPIDCSRNFGTCECRHCRKTRQDIIAGGPFYNNGSPDPHDREKRVAAFRQLEEQLNQKV